VQISAAGGLPDLEFYEGFFGITSAVASSPGSGFHGDVRYMLLFSEGLADSDILNLDNAMLLESITCADAPPGSSPTCACIYSPGV
jgi:hypothetical protein